nr:hypothetical protein KV8917_350056 [Klebsiella variicola]
MFAVGSPVPLLIPEVPQAQSKAFGLKPHQIAEAQQVYNKPVVRNWLPGPQLIPED